MTTSTSTPHTLNHMLPGLAAVGWFIPPFVQSGEISRIAHAGAQPGGAYDQNDLERDLAAIYGPIHLSAMVTLRYPAARGLKDYAATIEEAVEAHFLGLGHVAVAGLMPVIEGVGRQLAAAHGVPAKTIKAVFRGLTEACKVEATTRSLGAVGEVHSMLDSFAAFAEDFLYENSQRYPLADKTNRHGILHGVFSDGDYGRPLNFYKTIAAVDFLTFVSTFIGGGSWHGAPLTPRACFLAAAWLGQRVLRDQRAGVATPPELVRHLAEISNARPWLASLPIDEPIPSHP